MMPKSIAEEQKGKMMKIDKYYHMHGTRDNIIMDEIFPPLHPERKPGEWISDGPSYIGGYDWMHCSECEHKEIDCPAGRTNYCPNCGAKMK